MIAVSIVSHGHGDMVERLVKSLLQIPEIAEVIVTRNIPEQLALPQHPRIRLLDNRFPKGFGANHDLAFQYCHHPYYCVLNPDIELIGNPFGVLLGALQKDDTALSAPLVLAPGGTVEDSVRRFPTFRSLARKAFGGDDGRYPVKRGDPDFSPEWVAGMFMLFRSEDFARLNGFDEKFFLYYEDVDICARLWKAGLKIVVCPSVTVIHDARRGSRRNFRLMRLHLSSMARYFWKHQLWLQKSKRSG